jgi:sterigmatocystin 8-O-methyltransferase
MSAVRFAEEIVTPTAFPWETLPPGATIVDVGGGIGRVAMEISEKFPDYKYVIQDFSILTDQAKKVG